ncbi:MAG: hypothetical protein M5U32_06355 [Myxococcota bacterium]|nr:hypothetical protein [Myxococcota bacterium]
MAASLAAALVRLGHRRHDRHPAIDLPRALAFRHGAHFLLDLHRESFAQALEHLGVGRELALGDLDAVHVLQVPEVPDVERRHQRQRDAGLAGPSGAAGAVHVALGRVRGGVADHAGEIGDVDAARGDVGRHQEAQLAGLDARHRALAGGLGEIAGDLVGVEAAPLQEGRDVADVVLGVAEDDRALGILVLEDADERLLLLLRRHQIEVVLDLGRCDLPFGERHELGFPLEHARERAHLLRHRRREQARLAVFLARQVAIDLAHVRPEAEREQLVGFVEHEEADLVELEAALAEVVEDPPRRADDDVRAGREAFELRAVADAAVDR